MSDPIASGLLGPAGAAALGEAVRTLADLGVGPEPATLRVAGWTELDWAFRFQLPEDARQVVVHVPHDGRPPVIRETGRGPDPLAPGGVPPP